ncbi:MAG: hypothetical protein KDK28_17590 [Maritimibacter sp.]|nr:hypothetical protein [Maritimibacter sp.]
MFQRVRRDQNPSEGFWQKFFGKLLRRASPGRRSAEDLNALVVAEDHHLAGILDRVIATPAELVQEDLAADDAFDIPASAPDHATLAGGLGLENLLHPKLGREKGEMLCHPANLPHPG